MSTDDSPDETDSTGRVPDLPALRGQGDVWERRFAYAYLTALVLVPIIALALAVWLDYLTVDVSVTASVAIGWAVEYTLIALFGLFVLFTFVQVARIAGIGFINRLAEALVTVLDNYQRPDRDRDE